MANTNNTNIPAFLTDRADRALWTAARTSAKAAHKHGVKVTAVLARLAASLVLSGSNLTELMSAVAQDDELSAHGVKADSIRAYRAPLRNLARCLSADAYATLTMGDAAINPVTARDWSLGKNGAADELMGAHNIDRIKLAADMMALMSTRAPSYTTDNTDDASKGDASKDDASKDDASKGDASKGDASKGDASKGDASKDDASKGDASKLTCGEALEVMVDAAQVLLNMTTRGELSDGERRMMMRNIAQIHAAFDATCAIAVGK